MEQQVAKAIASESFKVSVHIDDATRFSEYLWRLGCSFLHITEGPGTGLVIQFGIPKRPTMVISEEP